MYDSLYKYAYEFIDSHESVTETKKIYTNGDGLVCIEAKVKVNLPSKYIEDKVTPKGVKEEETIKLVFPSSFPNESPKFYLRNQFNKDFAHINPSEDLVNPCIYEGSNAELLQTPKWITSLIDQAVLWLTNAASDNMIDCSQGWEPIRTDDLNGLITFNRKKLLNNCNLDDFLPFTKYIQNKKGVFAEVIDFHDRSSVNKPFETAPFIIYESSEVSNVYMPSYISNYKELLEFAKINKITNIENHINKNLKGLIDDMKQKKIFISLFIKRPCDIIGQEEGDNIEILNFIVELKKTRLPGKGQRNYKNELSEDSKVEILTNRNASDTNTLKQFSGAEKTTAQENSLYKSIVQVGCGSLGSKVIMHLARNGNDNIKLIDNAFFSTHNNARHALFNDNLFSRKAELLKLALRTIGLENVTGENKSIIDIEKKYLESLKQDTLIIDSTASDVVSNYLNKINTNARVIKTTLYNNATVGIIYIEGGNRSVKLIDLYAYLCHITVINEGFGKRLSSSNADYQTLGQGCGSLTTVCTDASISLYAATMSNIIQKRIESGMKDEGELLIACADDDMNLTWTKTTLKDIEVLSVKDAYGDDWEIRVFPKVRKIMEFEFKKCLPKETGGIVIGHINMSLKTIVIVDLITNIKGSKASSFEYINGIEGLGDEVKQITKLSGETLTMVGTWHTHPNGGGPSSTDLSTKQVMLNKRENMPTVCLVYSNNRIIAF